MNTFPNHIQNRFIFYVTLCNMNLVQSKYNCFNMNKHSEIINTVGGNNFLRPFMCSVYKAAVCKDQGDIFSVLCKLCNIKCRLNILTWKEKSGTTGAHCLPEVYYNNKWNLFDVTWGCIYKKDINKYVLYSLQEILDIGKNANKYKSMNHSDPWYNQWHRDAGLEYNSYLELDKLIYRKNRIEYPNN